MSQSDMVISDQPGASFLTDLNAVIAALTTNSSGATQPATTYAYQWWADTTSGILKQRNAANNAWVNVLDLATGVSTGAATSGANNNITSMTGLTSPVREVRQIQPISASVAANALTISASALALEFRSATLGSGAVSFVKGTPANLVISSGSTLGTVSGQQSDIAVLAINNAGTIELAAVNMAGGVNLDETGVISTAAEGGAGTADSAAVVYSATARTGVPYQVIGIVRSTQATAGTWATAPSLVRGAGGNALGAMRSLGYGQTWNLLGVGERNVNTTYYNTTGRPIMVMIETGGVPGTLQPQVNYELLPSAAGLNSARVPITFIVPPGSSYSVKSQGMGVASWYELR